MREPWYSDGSVTVHHGDALAVLRTLPDNSIDAIVTDPPYGLAEHRPATIVAAMTAWCSGDREHVPDGRGFMGRAWDGFVPPPAVWDECLRVLKPGGHLLCFAGTRTVDLMGLSVRLAGLEIRDTITWHYGSGFPKSLDVSKAIDKARDDKGDVLCVTSYMATAMERSGITRRQIDEHMGTSDMAGWWSSRLAHRCALPTIEQWTRLREFVGMDDPVIDAEVWRLNGRKGAPGEAWEEREVVGTRKGAQAESTGRYGAWGNDDGTGRSEFADTLAATDAARQWQGWGTALKPASEPIIVARKPLGSTVAANVQQFGTGALNVDGCRVGAGPRPADGPRGRRPRGMGEQGERRGDPIPNGPTYAAGEGGRWPANVVLTHGEDCADVCVDGCPVAELDTQSGTLKSGANPTRRGSDKSRDAYGEFAGQAECTPARGADQGGASRFFPTFRYQAKAPTRERPKVDGVAHPTVKPLALMAWLVRLVTPPGGTVLDPFTGSGTTLQAARDEGFAAVGIEREASYLPLIAHRLGEEIGAQADPLWLFGVDGGTA